MIAEIAAPKECQKDIDRIMVSSDKKQLLRELEESFRLTVHHVCKTAALVRRLEELGCEITIQAGILPFMRRIAYGQLLPALFVTLQGDQSLLEKSAVLPLPEQQRIADNSPLKVMTLKGDHRMVPPLAMTRREISQVFARGKLRNDSEQIGFLRDQIEGESIKAASAEQQQIKVDKKNNCIVVRGVQLTAPDLARYLGELSRTKR